MPNGVARASKQPFIRELGQAVVKEPINANWDSTSVKATFYKRTRAVRGDNQMLLGC